MTLVVFIAFFGFNFVIPILPLYVRALGVEDVAQAALISGAMLGVSPLMSAIFSPIWGLVADRYGRKRMVQRAMLVMVGCCVLMALAQQVWQVFALRAAIGVFGGFYAMSVAYLVTVAPASRASAALGLMQSAQMGGTIVGPLSAGFVADHFGLRASLLSGAAVVLVGLVVLSLATEDDRRMVALQPTPAEEPATARPPRRLGGLAGLGQATRLPGFAGVMIVLILVQLVDRSFGPVLPLYVESLGTAPDQVASYAGIIISLAAFATAVSAASVGQLAQRLRVHLVLPVTLVGGVLLCLPMAYVSTPLQLLVTRALLGLVAGGTLTLVYALANGLVPPERKGAAFGVLSSVTLFGSALGPLLMGALARVDLRAVFLTDAALYSLALFVAWKLRPRPLLAAPRSA